jgi:hypothetical protein
VVPALPLLKATAGRCAPFQVVPRMAEAAPAPVCSNGSAKEDKQQARISVCQYKPLNALLYS